MGKTYDRAKELGLDCTKHDYLLVPCSALAGTYSIRRVAHQAPEGKVPQPEYLRAPSHILKNNYPLKFDAVNVDDAAGFRTKDGALSTLRIFFEKEIKEAEALIELNRWMDIKPIEVDLNEI